MAKQQQQAKRRKRRRKLAAARDLGAPEAEAEAAAVEAELLRVWGDDKEVARLENPTATTILRFVLPQWPKLVAENSLEPVPLREDEASTAARDSRASAAHGDDAAEEDALWDYFSRRLCAEEQAEALTIRDADKMRLVKCVMRAARLAKLGLQDGLFLAVQSPGRDAVSYSACVHSWDNLRCAGAAFERPPQDELEAGRKLFECTQLLDAQGTGPRSVLALRSGLASDARIILGGALSSSLGRGRLVQTMLRTGDHDDLRTMTNPQSAGTVHTHDKVASTLLSGSLPSLLATLLSQSVFAYVNTHKRLGPNGLPAPLAPDLHLNALAYLKDSLPQLGDADGPGADEVRSSLAQLAKKPTYEALVLLFTCPVAQWGSIADATMRLCAALLQDIHAKRMADALVTGRPGQENHIRSDDNALDDSCQAAKLRDESPGGGLAQKQQVHNAPKSLNAHDHPRSSQETDESTPATPPSLLCRDDSGQDSKEDTNSSEAAETPSDSECNKSDDEAHASGRDFKTGSGSDESPEEPSSTADALSETGENHAALSASSVTDDSDAEDSSAATPCDTPTSRGGADGPRNEAAVDAAIVWTTSDAVDSGSGEWKKVETTSRRARRNSYRQHRSRQARSLSPCRSVESQPAASKPASTRGSRVPLAPAIAASSSSSSSSSNTNDQKNAASSNASSVSSNASSAAATAHVHRHRGESGETISLSSLNSSSTGLEDGHTPPSWKCPSKLASALRNGNEVATKAAAKDPQSVVSGGGPDTAVKDVGGVSHSAEPRDGAMPARQHDVARSPDLAAAVAPAPPNVICPPVGGASGASKVSPRHGLTAMHPGFPVVPTALHLGGAVGPPLVVEGIETSVLHMLSQDLEEMSQGLDQIALTRRPWQLAVAERIRAAVQSLFPGATARLFGSLETGLAAPCSDVDMVVQRFNVPARVAMRTLADHLRGQSWVQMIQSVEHTAVPVIKLATAQIPISFGNQGSLINVDITFDSFSHTGLRTCALVRRLMTSYPPLKPLVLVLKQYLVVKGLNDPFVGGLSSYGLVLMVTAILQRWFPAGMQGVPCPSNVLGAVLVTFLREYACSSFIDIGVWVHMDAAPSPDVLAMMHMKSQHLVEIAKATAPAPLYILDPSSDVNSIFNVGRTCFGIHQVIQAFAEALEAIQMNALRAETIATSDDWSVLGSMFSTGHHRHVVNLVVQVWCPRENPVSQRKLDLRQWAITAKSVLESLEQKGAPCPLCQHKPHAPTCTLKSLLLAFPQHEIDNTSTGVSATATSHGSS